jgi:hypothetical protein
MYMLILYYLPYGYILFISMLDMIVKIFSIDVNN